MNHMLTYIKSDNPARNPLIIWLKKYQTHILVWVLFVLYEIQAVGWATGAFGHALTYLLHYGLNVVLFYFHADVVMPRTTKNGKQVVWKICLFILLEICVYLFLGYVINCFLFYVIKILNENNVTIDRVFISGGTWRSSYFIGFATGYYFLKSYLKANKEKESLKRQSLENIIREKDAAMELTKTRNAYLQAQINPHFLFNTLNFIYANTRKSEPAVANSIILLSKIMRYAIGEEHKSELIPLADEINQVTHLINLWQILHEDLLYVKFTYDKEVESLQFIPLVLLTLVENIFKHGNLSVEKDPALISLQIINGSFIIETSNLINTGINKAVLGTGLKNINHRLKYAYSDSASFEHYVSSKNTFNTRVIVKI